MATLLDTTPCEDPASLYRECANRNPPIPTVTWYGKANGFDLHPVGREHGRGWLLLSGENLTALGTTSDHTLTFSGTDSLHKYTLQAITILSAQCVTPGYDGDPKAAHLVNVADRRYHLARIPSDVAFNVRTADGTSYLTSTTNGGTAWTWQEVVDELVTDLGEDTAEFVLPFTPDGTPENLTFWGGMAWDALNDVLDRVACAPLYDVEADTFSVVRLGVSDSAATDAQTKYVNERTWDIYPTDPERAWRPEKVRVRFLRRPAPTGGESPYYTVDVALAAADGVKAGTFVPLDDDNSALGATGTPSNSAALATRAAERAADWLRKRSGFGRPLLKVYRDFIPGIVRDVPGATVGGLAFDDRGGPMRTEIVSRPDKRLEEWKPFAAVPPWFSDGPGSATSPHPDGTTAVGAGWLGGLPFDACLEMTVLGGVGACSAVDDTQTVDLLGDGVDSWNSTGNFNYPGGSGAVELTVPSGHPTLTIGGVALTPDGAGVNGAGNPYIDFVGGRSLCNGADPGECEPSYFRVRLTCAPCGVETTCCADDLIPETLTVSLASPCACFNYTKTISYQGLVGGLHRWESAAFDDPCSPDTQGVFMVCDAGTWKFGNNTSSECGIALTAATSAGCDPFLAVFDCVINGNPCTGCTAGVAVTVTVSETAP